MVAQLRDRIHDREISWLIASRIICVMKGAHYCRVIIVQPRTVVYVMLSNALTTNDITFTLWHLLSICEQSIYVAATPKCNDDNDATRNSGFWPLDDVDDLNHCRWLWSTCVETCLELAGNFCDRICSKFLSLILLSIKIIKGQLKDRLYPLTRFKYR